MTVAAIYARFSSDSQREESIEIQVETCTDYILKKGWEVGDVYCDYAKTGTNDDRREFQRAIGDGEAGLYDVLVVLKNDRFARNVEIARKYKRRLKAAGRRFVSVREGESDDTPASFLHEAMDEAFAEYYSRNLAVLIKDGIAKNAENCKVSGRRIFGYRADENDRYIIDEDEAAIVREMFERYVGGDTVNTIELWVRDKGIRTTRGNPLSKHTITKMLKNDAYAGVYRYAGVVVDGGMPAIIGKGMFQMAQETMRTRQANKRRQNVGDYLLSEKLRCLRCGKSMSGVSGTGKNGRKYMYYGCVSKAGNCGLRIPADKIEDAVVEEIKAMLADESTVSAMVEAVLDYADSLPNLEDSYAEERQEVLKRRDNLVNSIAEGVPASAVKDAVMECESRLSELDMLIAREQFNREKLMDEAEVRAFLSRFIDKADGDEDRARLLVDTFIDVIYTDDEKAVVMFALGDEERHELMWEQAKALVNDEHPLNRSSEGVRIGILWWSAVTQGRNLYHHGQVFAMLVNWANRP